VRAPFLGLTRASLPLPPSQGPEEVAEEVPGKADSLLM